jgi:hypothetical protein
MSFVAGRPSGDESGAAPVRYGLRGAIVPAKSWCVDGDTGSHVVSFDCGALGRGPLGVTVDGKRFGEVPKPGRARPSILGAPFSIDGRQVLVYAESLDFGDTVTVDVFVDGVSLTDGRTADTIELREAEAARRGALYRSPMDPVEFARAAIRGLMLSVTGLGILRVIVEQTQKSLVRAGLIVIYCVGMWLVGWASLRILDRVTRAGERRGLRASLVVAGCLVLATTIALSVIYLASRTF